MGGALLRGIVAGSIGAWIMDRVTWLMQDREQPGAIARERTAWPHGLDVSHDLGNRVTRWLGWKTDGNQPSTVGMTTHYLLGIVPAVVYAGLREKDLSVAKDCGLLYGLSIFLLWDEALSSAIGIAGKPQKYPAAAHLRGLAGHLALGLATHIALTPMERDFGLRSLSKHPGA